MQLEIGTVLECKVTGITKFGAFVELPEGKSGMIHVSQIASTFVKDIHDHLKEGDIVKAKIIQIDENGRISLSIKKAADPAPRTNSFSRPVFNGVPDKVDFGRDRSGLSFEEMMSKYKQDSEEKIADWKRGVEAKRGSSTKRR